MRRITSGIRSDPVRMRNPTPAVVVGACSHGLAIARGLAQHGVPVHVVESNRNLPGTSTTAARVQIVPSISGPELLKSLRDLAKEGLFDNAKPVLFLTNDRMVGQVAQDWPALAPHYQLSWSESRAAIRTLLEKSEHAVACGRAGCHYPTTVVIRNNDDCESLGHDLPYPVIVKPSQPLSAFKVRVAESRQALVALRGQFEASMPWVVQPFIAGGDERIRFTAFYLRDGEPVARFEGRKLESRPMGHTTIAEAYQDTDATDAAIRFFRTAGISGPASLEVKKDEQGQCWVIEPTVGRTDFWLQLCVSNGVNFPWIEYCDVVGGHQDPMVMGDKTIWLNSDRDRSVLWRYARLVLQRRARVKLIRFSFLSASDVPPFLAATRRNIGELANRIWRRLGRSARLTKFKQSVTPQ